MLAIFLDIETTGLDPLKHHAIDVALSVIDITHFEKRGSYQSVIDQPLKNWLTHDPVSIAINGYTFDELKSGKSINSVKEEIIQLFQSIGIKRGSSLFICQNPGFDRAFFAQLVDVYTQEKLNWPYHWLDLASMYFTEVNQKCIKENKPFPKEMNFSKDNIAKAYGLEKEATPHKAINGVNHLIACYQALFTRS